MQNKFTKSNLHDIFYQKHIQTKLLECSGMTFMKPFEYKCTTTRKPTNQNTVSNICSALIGRFLTQKFDDHKIN